ncbi:MAG: hypothetical protein K6T90_08800 [Leptolyngbyaceae cyanobacterium HOT.MB2.61]|nr:hypothetical protein [Leptolyngbyaceae cyanobacterium HOT.MB2.61]
MKCIQCGTDNTLKDRTSAYGRCKNCQHPFVFEPTSMGNAKITDPMFAKAIADLSANGTLFFTPKQFFYFIENRGRTKSATPLAALLFIFVVLNIWGFGFIGGLLMIVMGGSKLAFPIALILINLAFIATLYYSSQSSRGNYHSRKQAARGLQAIGGITLVAGSLSGLLIYHSLPLAVIAVTLGILAIVLGRLQLSKQSKIAQTLLITQDQFGYWLTRWQQVNGPIEKMLSPPQQDASPVPVTSDITAYSFDRLVVCDRPEMAQLLIANNFHFENNCAILSITGYPPTIFNTTMEMLRRNPDLKVYALHDCTAQGIGLVHHLRSSPDWFPDRNIAVIDVGLSPRQILSTPGIFVQNSVMAANAAKQMPPEVRQLLSPDEIAWLEAGNFVELESFTPQRLIHVLNRGIAGSRELEDSRDGGIIFLGDSGGYYASDSFG